MIDLFADHLFGDVMEQAFEPVTHIAQIAISLIKLDGGELRVMSGVDAFVSEDTADLIDPVDAADHALLEVELGGDTEIEVSVEGVEMGDERLGARAA